MFKHFSTKELVFIAMMSASIFIINLISGSAIVGVTGIPMTSAFATAITMGLWILILIKVVPKVGAITLFLLIYSILEMPTTLGGAPGFWPKIPINVISGILGDLFLYLTKYRLWGLITGFIIIASVNLGTFAFFLWVLGLPGVDKLLPIIHIIIVVYAVLGSLGIVIGNVIWKRIKDKRIIQQISS
ncbi:MptD family putative ECF transporter S component [Candidatus Woesearchaeota archaeon]|nr:MptD family putative ECF transporter S component [Candidatus Woesearchaeota archaeon]